MASDLPSRDRLQLAREYRDLAGCGGEGDDFEDICDLDSDLGELPLNVLQSYIMSLTKNYGLSWVGKIFVSCGYDHGTCIETMMTNYGKDLTFVLIFSCGEHVLCAARDHVPRRCTFFIDSNIALRLSDLSSHNS